jgi:uncharacterized protein YceH (UPF0502 family)
MNIELDPIEARVIGSLIEKSLTTPEQYPLSLNALVNACNQKSSREPVMQLDAVTVQNTVDGLASRYLIRQKSGYGGRVAKYHHRLYNDEIGDFRFDEQEMAVVCLLLLRGPQTPGELRTRAARLCAFDDVAQVEAALARLVNYEQGPFVVRLAREPGRREARYAHLFSGAVELPPDTAVPVAVSATDPGQQTLQGLERRVAALEAELERLRSLFESTASTASDD